MWANARSGFLFSLSSLIGRPKGRPVLTAANDLFAFYSNRTPRSIIKLPCSLSMVKQLITALAMSSQTMSLTPNRPMSDGNSGRSDVLTHSTYCLLYVPCTGAAATERYIGFRFSGRVRAVRRSGTRIYGLDQMARPDSGAGTVARVFRVNSVIRDLSLR